MVATIILSITAILIPDALEVLARELVGGAGLVPGIAHLTLVRTVSAIIVVVA